MSDDSVPLDGSAKQALLGAARATLLSYLTQGAVSPPAGHHPAFFADAGAFVTLRRGPILRGCIGHIFPGAPLIETVQECAVSAAVEDSRFPPVTLDELPRISIEISVLTPPVAVERPEEILPGKHGLIVTHGFRRGVLLPQVAREHGWDREEFLRQTCRKAGLSSEAWKGPGIRLEVFSATVFSEDREP